MQHFFQRLYFFGKISDLVQCQNFFSLTETGGPLRAFEDNKLLAGKKTNILLVPYGDRSLPSILLLGENQHFNNQI